MLFSILHAQALFIGILFKSLLSDQLLTFALFFSLLHQNEFFITSFNDADETKLSEGPDCTPQILEQINIDNCCLLGKKDDPVLACWIPIKCLYLL
jgi:hypothetical protein